MVSLGSIFSSIWITVANSWQQTPAGFEIRERTIGEEVFRRAEIVDFWAMVFNPSSVHRLVHVWFGAFILGAFFVLSVSSWYLLRGRHIEFAKRSFAGALVMALVFSWAQIVSGHLQAENVAEHQPAKLAAFEGLYRTEANAPLYLWGWPDDEGERVAWGLGIPGFLSWLATGDAAAEVPGLAELEAAGWGRPPVWITFQSYHLMIVIGVVFALAILALGNLPRAVFLNRPAQAFTSSAVLIVALVGLAGIDLFPNLVTSSGDPAHSLTIYNAASSQKILGIMAIIAAIGMPFVLAYTIAIYWTFRGKVKLDEHAY